MLLLLVVREGYVPDDFLASVLVDLGLRQGNVHGACALPEFGVANGDEGGTDGCAAQIGEVDGEGVALGEGRVREAEVEGDGAEDGDGDVAAVGNCADCPGGVEVGVVGVGGDLGGCGGVGEVEGGLEGGGGGGGAHWSR